MKFEYIKTNKYKYCNAYYYFTLPNSKKKRAALKILSNIIGECSKEYNTKEKMSFIKDMLYGASIICGTSSNDEYISFHLNYSFLNPKFTNIDENEYFNFFKEIMFNCEITNELVIENKKLLNDNIKRSLEKPNILAFNNIIEIITKDEPSIESHNMNIIDDINSLSLQDVIDAYNELINDSDIVVAFYGNLKDNIIDSFKSLNLGGNIEYHLKEEKLNFKLKEMIINELPYTQSSLFILYTNPITSFSYKYESWIVGDLLLGGLPTSLLFEEVREKQSLCYDISVSEFGFHGISYIKTNIDGDKFDIVIAECKKQIQRLIDKDYDLLKLEYTKKLLINSLIQSQDDFEICAKRIYNQYLYNKYLTLEEKIENIKKINVDDISNIFRNYQPYFIYLLKGNKHEENS